MGLSEFLQVLRRQWIVVAVCVVVAIGTAVMVSSGGAPSYSAQATVLLTEGVPADVESFIPALSRLIDREFRMRVALIRSEDVAIEAAELLGSDEDPQSILAKISVSSDDQAQEVKIVASGSDAEAAADLANAFATAYAMNARIEQEVALDRAESALDALIEEGADSVEYAPPPDGVSQDADVPVPLGDDAYEELAWTRNRIRTARETQVDPVLIIAQASAPVSEGSGTLRTAVFGGLAGLVLGILLALLIDYIARGRRETSA